MTLDTQTSSTEPSAKLLTDAERIGLCKRRVVELQRLLEAKEASISRLEMKAHWWDILLNAVAARGYLATPDRPFQAPFRLLDEYDQLMATPILRITEEEWNEANGVDKPTSP